MGIHLYFLKTSHQSENTEYIFYPYGFMVSGFLVNENIKDRLEELEKLYFFLLTMSLSTMIYFYDTLYVFNISVTTIFFIGIILKVFIARLIARKYSRSGVRITIGEQKRLFLKELKPEQSIVFFIGIIITTYFSTSVLLSPKHSWLTLFLEIIATVYYVLLFIWNLYLHLPKTNKSNEKMMK